MSPIAKRGTEQLKPEIMDIYSVKRVFLGKGIKAIEFSWVEGNHGKSNQALMSAWSDDEPFCCFIDFKQVDEMIERARKRKVTIVTTFAVVKL